MTKLNKQQFYHEVGQAKDGRFTEEAYHLLADHALDVYHSKEAYWKQLLVDGIQTRKPQGFRWRRPSAGASRTTRISRCSRGAG